MDDYLEDVLSVQNSISQLNSKTSKTVDDERFLKPFELGWKREVVMRVITDSKRPNCDIYYFHPNGRKFRSMAEIKANLMDGLDPECFTFKKQPLNVASEMIRQARARGKSSIVVKTESERRNDQRVPKHKTGGIAGALKKSRSVDKKPDVDEEKKPRSLNMRLKSRRQSMIQKKQQLKAVMNLKKAKQARVPIGKKKVKKTIGKSRARTAEEKEKVTKSSKTVRLNKNQIDRRKRAKSRPTIEDKKAAQARKKETAGGDEEMQFRPPTPAETSEEEGPARAEGTENEILKDIEDIKSIVQKNIVKYREMRRKEMLEKFERKDKSERISKSGVLKSESFGRSASRHRSGNISENFEIFLEPLEKGWKRELVFRNGAAYAKGQSDVYYYHPNGRKFRSAREVAEHLTPGLSIDNFTFRKEPLGCGEPKEIIRNARPHQKNLVSSFPLRMVKK